MTPGRVELQRRLGLPMHRFGAKQARAVAARIAELETENAALKAKLARWGRPKNVVREARRAEAAKAPVLVFDPKTGDLSIEVKAAPPAPDGEPRCQGCGEADVDGENGRCESCSEDARSTP